LDPSTRQIENASYISYLLERSPEKAGVGGSINGYHILKDLVITKDLMFFSSGNNTGTSLRRCLLAQTASRSPVPRCRLGNVAAPSSA
jgi:hypothetical protein